MDAGIQTFGDTLISGTARGKPGWTEYVKDFHNCASEYFIMWCDTGKPKQGHLF